MAILRKLIAPLAKPLDITFGRTSSARNESDAMPRWVLICGLPRSGGTLSYQVASRVLPCRYVTNLHQVLPRSAHWLIFRHRDWFSMPSGLRSYYGHTSAWLDVNEGNEIVDYWFRTDEPTAVRQRFIETMRWLGGKEGDPVIVKNVKVYDRLQALHSAVPELIFVRIRRERQQNVQSELRAFRELGYFNPMPSALRDERLEDPVWFAVRHTIEMEATLDRQLKNVPACHLFEWTYEDICEDLERTIKPLAEALGVEGKWQHLNTKLKVSRARKVLPVEEQRIADLLSEYSSQSPRD